MSKFSIPENVAVSDSGFLFLPSTGETFTLNEIGRAVFKLMQTNVDSEAIYTRILDEYDIDRNSLDRDFNDFVSQLKNYNLIKAL